MAARTTVEADPSLRHTLQVTGALNNPETTRSYFNRKSRVKGGSSSVFKQQRRILSGILQLKEDLPLSLNDDVVF